MRAAAAPAGISGDWSDAGDGTYPVLLQQKQPRPEALRFCRAGRMFGQRLPRRQARRQPVALIRRRSSRIGAGARIRGTPRVQSTATRRRPRECRRSPIEALVGCAAVARGGLPGQYRSAAAQDAAVGAWWHHRLGWLPRAAALDLEPRTASTGEEERVLPPATVFLISQWPMRGCVGPSAAASKPWTREPD